MNTNINRIYEEKIIIGKLKKTEFRFKILKSIMQNNNINIGKQMHVKFNIIKNGIHRKMVSKKNDICLYSGKRKSITSKSNLSRYTFKSFLLSNRVANVKKT